MEAISYEPLRTVDDTKTIQALSLEDMRRAGFGDAKKLADPENDLYLQRQYLAIHKNPNDYLCAYLDDSLVGYMHMRKWTFQDQIDFGLKSTEPYSNIFSSANQPPTQPKLGITKLVVSDEFDETLKGVVAEGLHYKAVDRALRIGATAIHTIVNENNQPLQQLVHERGYLFSGLIGESAAERGGMQRLYTYKL